MTALSISNGLRKQVWAFGPWAGVLFFLFNIHPLPAQGSPTFEVSIQAKEVLVGVPFEVTFQLKNAEGTRFTPPSFPGFSAGAISEMRGMSYVNGKSSTSQSWILELTPNKPGVFSIGVATVLVAGQTLSTKPLTVNVLYASNSFKGNVNVPPGSDDRIFIAAEFDRKKAYIGQQVSWRIRLYTQLSVEGYDIIALPEFDGFYSKEKIRYDKRVEYINLRKKKYAVRTLHEEALFPQETGELLVGAARVSVGIEQPGAQGFLFGPKPVSLQTQPISLTVSPLPPAPSPEFTGGVGQYSWEVKADTTQLTTDDALTIIVEVKGNGDARRFAPPKISAPLNCEIFEPRILEEEEYESETGILHRKRLEYIVLPKDTGTLEIQPMLAYFDTDSNRYGRLLAPVIRFAVTPGKNYSSPNVLSDTLSAEPSLPKLPGFWEKFAARFNAALWWSLWVIPLLILGVFLWFRKQKPTPPILPKPASPDPPKSQSSALEAARQRFQHAGRLLKDEDPIRFYDELLKSLQAWLSARVGLQPAQFNDTDVQVILTQRGATPIRIQALLSVWHTCEQAIYGGQAQVEQMESNWQMAGQVMEALDKEIR